VLAELDDGSLSIRSGGHDDDVGGVLDAGDDTGGQLDLLPGLIKVDEVDSVVGTVTHVGLHVEVEVGGTNVAP